MPECTRTWPLYRNVLETGILQKKPQNATKYQVTLQKLVSPLQLHWMEWQAVFRGTCKGGV